MEMECLLLLLLVLVLQVIICCASPLPSKASDSSWSAVGDPGMRRDGLRVALEAWNFCNEVGDEEAPSGSPRAADCFDISHINSINHLVSEADNRLGVGKPFPGLSPGSLNDPDRYAVEKELYLGSLCQVIQPDSPRTRRPWQFWMIMLKNGNYDTRSGLCPQNGKKVPPFPPGRFPCFGKGCMNQPLIYHTPTTLHVEDGDTMRLRGGFNGTYDLGGGDSSSLSYFEVVWEKRLGGEGSWVFTHKLKTSKLYPWLMLYLRADATKGFSGGYHYDTRGMLNTVSTSKLNLNLPLYIHISCLTLY